ncbi:20221_t:CDS:2, partial [Gigaspora rosea]
SDIVSATQNLAGTHLANIEPNRNQTTNPSENLEAGMEYIVARPLPHFGAPAHFSPAIIANL